MRVKLWGTRGSVPTPTSSATRYGGNTPCIEARAADGERIVLDAGIGLHWLGRTWGAEGFVAAGGRAHLLLTHTHWGHIQGLPFFTPMLSGACSFRVYGDGGVVGDGQGDGVQGDGVQGNDDRGAGLHQLLLRQMDAAYCPVPNFLEERIGAGVEVVDLDGEPFNLGATRVTPRRVHHVPGTACLGFRLDNERSSMAYIPDVEYPDDEARRPALELAAGVDLLIHDAHYTADEYRTRRGRGHCSDVDAVELGRDAGARRVLLFHHHPDRDDRSLDAVAAGHGPGGLTVEAAAEGNEYVLDGT